MVRLLVKKNCRIDGAVPDIGFATGGGEGQGVIDPAHRVSQHQRAEEQHFAGEKHPYAKLAGTALPFEIIPGLPEQAGCVGHRTSRAFCTSGGSRPADCPSA